MKYFVIFSGAGLFTLFASTTPDSILLTLILANISVAFLALGLAYGLKKPQIFQKEKNGHVSFFGHILFWPYWALNSFGMLGYRLLGIENPMDEIVPGLYLGSKPLNLDKRKLTQNGIFSVIDLTAELREPRFIRKNCNYLCIPILDNNPPSLQQLREAIQWIEANIKRGAVLVHCAFGHGRSATCVAAYLLHANKTDKIEKVVEYIKRKRPGIGLTTRQSAILQEYVNNS